ncbi:RNase adapter RapZ [Nocardia testacea]|uniref:RNase adapter RapZ n=1 Tax=Nocardia testacea TaxID=248551 RepID=UPI003A8BB806
MTVLLVTGRSGTGKSAALILLEERGYRVVDTDYGGWTEHIPGSERQPPGAAMARTANRRAIADHERSGEHLLIGGTVSNQVPVGSHAGRYRWR